MEAHNVCKRNSARICVPSLFPRREEIAALDERATDVETAIVGGAIRIHFAKAMLSMSAYGW
jgi:hypothetical protein